MLARFRSQRGSVAAHIVIGDAFVCPAPGEFGAKGGLISQRSPPPGVSVDLPGRTGENRDVFFPRQRLAS